MRIVGIDIGSFSIKIAEVEASAQTTVLKDFYEVELNHSLGQDERFEKVEKLREIAQRYDLQQTRFVTALGSEFISARILDFPFIEKRKILQSLPFELEDNIPFSQENAIFDFRLISQNQNTSQVLAVAAPKKYIKEVLQLFEDAGIDPDLVSVDGIARSNLFESTQEYNSQSEVDFSVSDIFVHVGYKKTLINVTKNGKLCTSRAIFFGGFDLATSISRAYEIPFLEALKGVKDNGFVLTSNEGADEDQIAFSQIIAQSLSILVNEIKRTIVDLKAEQKLNFKAIYLSGGMSGLINLSAYITKEVNITAVLQNSLPANLNSEITLAPASEKAAAVAVGLALEGAKKPLSLAINLRKNEFSKQGQGFKVFYERNKTAILSATVTFCFFFIFSFLRGMFVEDNLIVIDQIISDQAKSNTLGLTKAEAKPEALKRFVKNKRQELESKKEVVKLGQMLSALDVMKALSVGVPTKNQIKLDITYFNIKNESVTMEGTVANKDEFGIFQKKLNQLPQLTQLKIGPAPKADSGKYFFQVSMNYKRSKLRDSK